MGQQVRHLLQKRESTSDNHASARQRVEWPRGDLIGYIIQVESRVTGTAVWWKTTFTFGSESTFFVENSSFPLDRPAANSKLVGPYLFHLSSPEENPPPLRIPYLFWLYICGHLISMRVHPPRLQHSFLLRLKSLFLLIFHVFLFMVLMELHCNKSSFSAALLLWS